MNTEITELIQTAIIDFTKQRERLISKYVTMKTVFEYQLLILPNGVSYLQHRKTKEDLIRFLPVEFRKLDEEGHFEIAQKYEILKEI